MVKKKNKSCKNKSCKQSSKRRHEHHDERRQELPQQQQEQEPERAYEQPTEHADNDAEEKKPGQKRSSTKWHRLVEVVQERRRQQQRTTEGAGSAGDGQRPHDAPQEQEPDVAEAVAIVQCAAAGAVTDDVQRSGSTKKTSSTPLSDRSSLEAQAGTAGDSADARVTHLEETATASGSARQLLPYASDDRPRIWQPDRELLDELQSAADSKRDTGDLLDDFLNNTGRLAQIIQCRSLDIKQTQSSFYELLLPLIDRILTECFSERLAECLRLLRGFFGSATFMDGLCRPATIKTLTAEALRHLVALVQLAVQELPSEYAADDGGGGYFAFPAGVFDGIVRANHSSDVQLCAESERLVMRLHEEREFERQCTEALQNLLESGSYDEAGQPTDYRQVSLLPTDKELRVGRKPDLPANRLDGNYADEREYIETHFRLLREDFVGPLRIAVQEYRSRSARGDQFRRLDAGSRLYRDVTLLSEFEANAVRFLMSIRGPALDTWESSKGLTNGSLLVLSRDDFSTMAHATVHKKCRARDGSAHLLVHLLTGHQHVLQALHSAMDSNCRLFVVIESESYYEAFRHNAAILQRMSPIDMPFRKYLIERTTVIDPPRYIGYQGKATDHVNLAGQGRRYDLSAVIGSAGCALAVVGDVLDNAQWPAASALKLDVSQAEALKFALTKEFAIIQGPPGTGKTHVGTKIVDVLLANEKVWAGSGVSNGSQSALVSNQNADTVNTAVFKGQCIAIICYTNHALDQFLEHIVRKYPGKVCRVGGNSGNAVLDQYNIIELKKRLRIGHGQEFSSVRERIESLEKEIRRIMSSFHEVLSWTEAKHLLNITNAQQIGSDEDWKRWLKCTDLVEAKSMQCLETRLKTSSNRNIFAETSEVRISVSKYSEEPAILAEGTSRDDEWESLFYPIDFTVNDITEKTTHYDGNSRHLNDIKNNDWNTIITPNNHCLKERKSAQKSPLRMTLGEADVVTDMWRLGVIERHRMLNYLKYASQQEKASKLEALVCQLSELKQTMNELRMRKLLPVFKDRPIVGMTVTGAAKYSALMRLLKPRIVIIEEAAEVLEAHILTSLSESCQHLILIGDHQQLRPNPCMYELVRKHNLDVSLFERMVKYKELPYICLKVQHRMRPEISKVMTPIFYRDLLDHPCVNGRPHVRGMLKNIFFVKHNELEGGDDMGMRSHVNYYEAAMVAGLCGHLLKQAYEPAQITVLVAYLGQLGECKRSLQNDQQTQPGAEQIRVATVDNYQGEENDIIILSLVRSNDRGSVGFLSTDNRICVALSRARLGFYCFGNFDLLSMRSETWRSITTFLSLTKEIGNELQLACHRHPEKQFSVSKPKDFSDYTDGHGCTSSCDERLPCGHSCSDLCHSDDLSHNNQHRCRKPCMKLCTAGMHKGSCKRLCSQPCEPCREGVPRTFDDCGHTCTVECSLSEYDVCCMQPVSTTQLCKHEALTSCHQNRCTVTDCRKQGWILSNGKKRQVFCGQMRSANYCFVLGTKTYQPCGHKVQVSCHALLCCHADSPACTITVTAFDFEETTLFCKDFARRRCRTLVKKELSCGHSVSDFCYKDVRDIPCTVVVEKSLACGHMVFAACSADIRGMQCESQMSELLSCGHELKYVCYMSNKRSLNCEEVVTKKLLCGHRQLMLCYQDVTRQQCRVEEIKDLPCGHRASMRCDQDVSEHQCLEPSTKELPCGHFSSMPCFEDMRDKICNEPVVRELHCGHRVSVLCFQDTCQLQCHEQVEISLPCGHVTSVACSSQSESLPQCTQSVSKVLPCGHKTLLLCFKDPTKHKCQELIDCHLPCNHFLKIACFMNSTPDKMCEQPVTRLLPCGHRTELPCQADVGAYRCEQKVEKRCPNGHEALLKCHVADEQHGCQTVVKKPLPCGHYSSVMCYEDVVHYECHEPVTRTLSCDHRAQMLCFQDSRQVQCKTMVEKELPCGHRQLMPCHRDVSEQQCEHLIDEQLPCKHTARIRCGSMDYHELKCQQYTDKRLPCGHVVQSPCSSDVSNRRCFELVDWKLPCGHRRTASCHVTRCVTDGCLVNVQMTIEDSIDDVNSSTTFGTCQSLRNVKCSASVRTKLQCSHMATHACCKEVNSVPCLEVVRKRFGCGHDAVTSCHVNGCRVSWCQVIVGTKEPGVLCHQAQKQLAACSHPTGHILRCGHAAAGNVPCHVTRCKDNTCSLQLYYRQQMFECRTLCRRLLDDCLALVDILLACGHTRRATCSRSRLCTCGQSPAAALGRSDLAGGPRQRQLHWQQANERPQQQHYQQHQPAAPIATPATVCQLHAPCGELVEKVFKCGHRQMVACKDRDTLVACTKETAVVVPSCGHEVMMRCDAQQRSIALWCKEEHCALTCSHGGCSNRCSEPCRPCTRPCSTGCPHSQPCRRPCFRACLVPPCDQPCSRVLSCGHPCLGLCGESCPDVCLACPKGSLRQERLRLACAQFGVQPGSKFLSLQPCGHVIPLEKIDEAVRLYEENVILRSSASTGNAVIAYRVQPLPCPKCRKPVGACRRYESILKRYFNMKRKLPVNAVGEWLGCNKGHVRPAGEGSCGRCSGSNTRMLVAGQEVEVISGKDRGLVGTVTDIDDGEAVVVAESRTVVVAIELLRPRTV